MCKLNKFLLGYFLFCSVSCYAATEGESIIKAAVDKTSVETGQRIIYTLTVMGKFDNPQLNVPEFTGFTIIGRNQSQGYSYVNGKENINFNLVYSIAPTKPGTITIKGATLKTKDSEYSTQPITINVTGKPLEAKEKIAHYIGKGTDI